MKATVWIVTAAVLAIIATLLLCALGPFRAGVWIAVIAALVVLAELVGAVLRDGGRR